MPKALFYVATTFCLFLALTAVAGVVQQWHGHFVTFVAVHDSAVSTSPAAAWSIVIALFAAMAVSALLLRMAALIAARNLFAAFVTVVCVTAAIVSLVGVMALQSRMLIAARRAGTAINGPVAEMHFAAVMMLGCFLSLAFLALRPYFRIQASRFLAALVFFPFPLFLLILIQELFVSGSRAPLPAVTPASLVFIGAAGLLFLAIAVHCIRHRHIFIEMTNLRELLEARGGEQVIGGVAYHT